MTLLNEDEFSKGWFGYGNWSAYYWFVGAEVFGDSDEANCALWEEFGRAELLDIVAHHGTHVLDWFSDSCTTQPTWAKLICLLLAYKGVEPTLEATLEYQRQRFGRARGETALLALSSFVATNVASRRSPLRNEAYRITLIRQRMQQYRPKFVVFYSTRLSKIWSEIAGIRLIEGQPAMVGSTSCVVTYHPYSKPNKDYWSTIGRRLRGER